MDRTLRYCENCCKARCGERCGRKKLREIRNNDPVFLTEKEFFTAGIFEGALGEAEIPFMKSGMLGAGMTSYFGVGNEVYSFYVRYDDCARAKELEHELFDAMADDAKANDEEPQ
ncbi:MAG: hypothetical protein RR244_01775 [Oscillospiraceae bacterium]